MFCLLLLFVQTTVENNQSSGIGKNGQLFMEVESSTQRSWDIRIKHWPVGINFNQNVRKIVDESKQ